MARVRIYLHGDQVGMIYQENCPLLAAFPELTPRRAGNVEVTEDLSGKAVIFLAQQHRPIPPGMWWADLLRLANQVLGPYDTRQEALDGEVELVETLLAQGKLCASG